MKVHLLLKLDSPIRMRYSIPLRFRLSFLGIAVFILFALVATSEESLLQSRNTVPLVIAFVSIIGSLYNERWIFDKGKNLVEHHMGLLFFYRRKKFALDTLRKVRVTTFCLGKIYDEGKEGRNFRRMISLSLQDHNETVFKLEVVKYAYLATIRHTAERIARFCEIPLEDETTML